MSGNRLGDIPLKDYLEIVASPRRGLAPRWVTSLAIAVLCMLCTAAGDYLGPWSGKNSREMSYEHALAILQTPQPEQWATELGLGAMHQNAEGAIDAIFATAKRDADTHSALYLRNIALRSIQHLQVLDDLGRQPDVWRHLQALADELDK